MLRPLSSPSRAVLVLALGLGAAGCAPYGPPRVGAGATADDVARDMGPPTGRYAMPGGGTRLEFARGPFGKHTWMVDVDAGGRVTGWAQVLTESRFEAVRPGMPSDELLRLLGRPSERQRAARRNELWSYRYDVVDCRWYRVAVGPDARVLSSGYGPDPLCTPRE